MIAVPADPQIQTEVLPLDRRDDALMDTMTSLFQQGQAPHHAAYPAHFGPADDQAAIRQYLQAFLKPRNPLRKRYGLAKGWYVDGALKGYLLYRLNQSRDAFYGKTRWSCFIEDVVVDESTRGLGGASALMSAMLAETETHDDCVVSGNVWRMNDASDALFRKHGFEPLSQTFYRVEKP